MDLDEIGIGDALGTDYFHLREQMTAQQADYLARTREFVRTEVRPTIIDYWEKAEFPWPLIEKLGPVGIIGDGIAGYGCPDMDPMSAGLIAMEMTRGDGSMGTFLVVHGGLAMKSIFMLGSEEQKRKWLPPMARLEKIGAFALTEPDHGSDSVALETSARCDGDSYVINGAKKWIGNGTIAMSSWCGPATSRTARSRDSSWRKARRATTPARSSTRSRCGRSGRPRSRWMR